MKKLFISVMLALVGVACANAQQFRVTSFTTNGVFLLSTNSGNVANIGLVAGSGSAVTLYLFDNNTASTNAASTASFVTVNTYTTNQYLGEYVSTQGITNRMTNTTLVSVLVTNAGATNALSPIAVYSLPASGSYGPVDVNISYARGLVAVVNTNLTMAWKEVKSLVIPR